MKKRVFFFDLDNTILFSKTKYNPDTDRFVEKKCSVPCGWSNEQLFDVICDIEESENLDTFIVPVTTRSFEQYNRTIYALVCRYAVTSHGARILKNKRPLAKYEQMTAKDLAEFREKDLADLFTIMNLHSATEDGICRIVDNSFIFAKCMDESRAGDLYSYILNSAKAAKTNVLKLNKKVYVFPNGIGKRVGAERVLSEIMLDYPSEDGYETFAFGDNILDVEMADIADHAIIERGFATQTIRTDFETFNKRCDDIALKYILGKDRVREGKER